MNFKNCILIVLVYASSCSVHPSNEFEIKDFLSVSNYQKGVKEKTIAVDLEGAIYDGFVIPSKQQIKAGYFEFKFSVRNLSNKPEPLFYKIFYQNETYKFPEGHQYSNENFYGSWKEVSVGFKPTIEIPCDGNFHTVLDSFSIVGNPRDEKQYYGSKLREFIDEEDLQQKIKEIQGNPEWMMSLREKAKTNRFTLDKQIRIDAEYVIRTMSGEKNINHRWRRNPRMGRYSFLLVVTNRENLVSGQIPTYIININRLNNDSIFVNPYDFFLGKAADRLSNMSIVKSECTLTVSANINLSRGVYVSPASFIGRRYKKEYFNTLCGQTKSLFERAPFEQFIHSYNPAYTFNNIDKVADVYGGEYTKSDYAKNNVPSKGGIKVPIEVTDCPCKTLEVDSINKKIYIKTPATHKGEWRKENVGVISRYGLTYGKFRVKAKLPELLNKDNLWNGLTNAVWLIFQQGDWNKRRVCRNEGYVPKSYNGNGNKEKPNYNRQDVYSEIDIEIVKASRNWPLSSYGGDANKKPADPASDSDKVMLTYTNWDLACKDPQGFGKGIHYVEHNTAKYELHRWDSWYQAVTGKYPVLDDELFKGPYFWFEIEWKPTEIIWRIGPEKNNMREIGYVNENVSAIPNNQMLLVITQEWHLANWWPEAPFDQNRIPFPAKDIVGEVLEVEVE